MKDRKHPAECERAENKRCRCSCEGALHGVTVWKLTDVDEKAHIVSRADGGEIEKIITLLTGKQYLCFCGNTVDCLPLYGYPHDSGVPDASGQKLWLWQHCTKCSYDMAVWKIIKNRMTLLSDEKKMEYVATT